ncbi:MAG: acyl-CoA-binding protein [Vicinamibacteraceae bacterium]|nr:acyl-CoA-binding protein [Vicinamibacteraceae bacterium]
MQSDLVKAFEAAAAASKTLPSRPDNEALLRLYALYKQATVGDVSGERPGGLDFVGRAKYDAWAGLKGLTRDEAMRDYVGLVEELRHA